MQLRNETHKIALLSFFCPWSWILINSGFLAKAWTQTRQLKTRIRKSVPLLLLPLTDTPATLTSVPAKPFQNSNAQQALTSTNKTALLSLFRALETIFPRWVFSVRSRSSCTLRMSNLQDASTQALLWTRPSPVLKCVPATSKRAFRRSRPTFLTSSAKCNALDQEHPPTICISDALCKR